MKSMPTKKKLDVDKLIPLTKKEKELNKTKKKIDDLKYTSSSSKTKYKSEEFIDVDDAESVEPPSDDETLHPSSNNHTHMFSKIFKDIEEEEAREREQKMPSLGQTNTTEPTDRCLTPEATESHRGRPSTMTHLSEKNHQVSEYATSSSQLPYSSPTLDNHGRAKKLSEIVNPIPVRDKSSQIALLQKLANRGKLLSPRPMGNS
jgi:hypothetical protein